MSEFETPEPITLFVDVLVGDVRIAASDRSNTVVEVRPSDPERRRDVTAAEQTRVEYSGGSLRVKTTRHWRSYSPFSDGGSVDVQIELPTGSDVTGVAAVAALRSSGSLGDCRLKTSIGDIHIDECAAVELKTSTGNIDVERVIGNAEISTSTGAVRIGDVGGTAVIKNSNGDTRVGEVSGDLRVKAANGDIEIDQAHASLAAKTANGEIHIGSVTRGPVVAETGLGEVEIGIPDGTAAWLDLNTNFGQLRNALDTSRAPDAGENSVEVRARTGYGDIAIRRSYAAPSPDTRAERVSGSERGTAS